MQKRPFLKQPFLTKCRVGFPVGVNWGNVFYALPLINKPSLDQV
jgi:hypothetical protein